MKLNLNINFLTSILLLPKTALHSLLLPHRLLKKAISSTSEEWNEEHAPIGFILSVHIVLIIWTLSPAYGIPDGFTDASLGDKLAMATKHVTPIAFAASLLLATYVIVIAFFLIVISRRKMDRKNSSIAVRVSLLIPLPYIVLTLVRAGDWLTLRISDPNLTARAKKLGEGGLDRAEILELVRLAMPHWQTWVLIWPWLLCVALIVFYCAYFVATGWRERV
jgi:hypothetical protein